MLKSLLNTWTRPGIHKYWFLINYALYKARYDRTIPIVIFTVLTLVCAALAILGLIPIASALLEFTLGGGLLAYLNVFSHIPIAKEPMSCNIQDIIGNEPGCSGIFQSALDFGLSDKSNASPFQKEALKDLRINADFGENIQDGSFEICPYSLAAYFEYVMRFPNGSPNKNLKDYAIFSGLKFPIFQDWDDAKTEGYRLFLIKILHLARYEGIAEHT